MLQQLGDLRRAALGAASPAVDRERLGDDVADGHARVERRVGILEDHLHVRRRRRSSAPLSGRDVAALEADRARGRLDQAQYGAADGRLAAPALAHEAEGLAAAKLEARAVHGAHVAGPAAAEAAAPTGKCIDEIRRPRGAARVRLRRGRSIDRRLRHGSPRSGRRQATVRPSATGRAGRASREALGDREAHRGWNGQPAGRWTRSGGARRWRRAARAWRVDAAGSLRSSPRCRDVARLAKISSRRRAPRPARPAYMTATGRRAPRPRRGRA